MLQVYYFNCIKTIKPLFHLRYDCALSWIGFLGLASQQHTDIGLASVNKNLSIRKSIPDITFTCTADFHSPLTLAQGSQLSAAASQAARILQGLAQSLLFVSLLQSCCNYIKYNSVICTIYGILSISGFVSHLQVADINHLNDPSQRHFEIINISFFMK